MRADLFSELLSVTVCLLSGALVDAPLLRLTVEPTEANGLSAPCQIMIDEIDTVPRGNIGYRIGVREREAMVRVDRSLTLFLGVA